MSIFGTLIDDLNDKTVKGSLRYYTGTCLLIAALACLASCAQKKPEGILSKQEMLHTMGKIYIAEEKVNRLTLKRDSAEDVFVALKRRIFEDAGLTDSIFKRSFDYYMEHPQEMEAIYMALVDTLQLREQRAPIRLEQQ